MAQPTSVEFIIVRLAFLPYVDPLYPRFKTIRKKHPPNGSIAQVRDWFDSILMRERSQLPADVSIRYTEWRIVSGNINLFLIDDFYYDKIMLVLGEHSNYWIYYQNYPYPRRLECNGYLPIAYCSCCLHQQYLNIMECVKDTTLRKKGVLTF